MKFTDAITLEGQHVSLEPLSHRHEADLIEAVKDGALWLLWYTSVPAPEQMRVEIDRRLLLHTQGSMLPFAVVERPSNTVVGMTTFLNVDAANRRVEIGSTWYSKRVQRTALNTECKLLLLTHAFETLACIAVEFRTHFMNHQSRSAIERLGARLDGVLRQHRIDRTGTIRDTCVYSIVDHEWPTVKTHLNHQLAVLR
jgi:RimJ/RimL family protein N-acetyltransferase